METEERIQLTDESVYPDEKNLKSVLGRSYGAYTDLLNLYEEKGLSLEWRYYKDGKAWLCKVHRTKKIIVWMSAWKGYVQAAIYVHFLIFEDILCFKVSEEL